MKRFDRPWWIAVAVLPLALGLGGCSLLPGTPSIPNVPAIPGDGGDVEDIVEGSGDGIDYEEGELPAGFPADDIPLVPGEIVLGMTIPGSEGGSVWQVNISVAGQSVADTADDLMLAAGFSNESGFAFENETYLVVVTTAEASDGWQVGYIVTENP